eukprot:scaffold48654_cov51-Attheya_sp.AAC.1
MLSPKRSGGKSKAKNKDGSVEAASSVDDSAAEPASSHSSPARKDVQNTETSSIGNERISSSLPDLDSELVDMEIFEEGDEDDNSIEPIEIASTDQSVASASASVVSTTSSVATQVRTNVDKSSSSRRGVTFEIESKNLPSSHTKSDENMSQTELIANIVNIREQASQLKIDYSGEKALRKKKEKNIIKLAKQLNIRSGDIADRDRRIDLMVHRLAERETKLETTKRELDELTSKSEKTSREYHAEITASQNKYREACRESDIRISELNDAHAKQCENLRRTILSTNLEADKLRMQVAGLQMRQAPGDADAIMARTMRNATTGADSREQLEDWYRRNKFVVLITIICIPLLALIFKGDLLSLDAMCAPCIPGTEFGPHPVTCDAPWWAPGPVKQGAFDLMCGNYRVRSHLEWTGGTKSSRLSLTDLGSKDSHILLDKQGASAKLNAHEIIITNKGGKSTEFPSPWNIIPRR